jgi:hypothetical protein
LWGGQIGARVRTSICIALRTVTIDGYRHPGIGPFNFRDTECAADRRLGGSTMMVVSDISDKACQRCQTEKRHGGMVFYDAFAGEGGFGGRKAIIPLAGGFLQRGKTPRLTFLLARAKVQIDFSAAY